jgi:cyclic pyranopterin phosphate synthase
MAVLADRYGRTFPYLRLSLLEACNFRCSYCLPDGYHAGADTPRWLTREEIARLLRGFAAVGLRKLRLTGGEPSLRADLSDIIADAAATPGIETVAMTTNGILLRRRFAEWRAAGLDALNVSLDSLDPARFRAITGRDRGLEILEGVELALASNLPAIKLNAVLLRGLNDDELPAWLDYLRTRRLTVRFIELMQTGENHDYFRRHHVRAEALEQSLLQQGWRLLARAADAGPAREYAHPEFRGRIGIIAPYSRDFCAGCNRLRVTAGGDLRLCLFGEFGIPLRPLLQSDDRIGELVATLHAQLGLKKAGHGLHEGRTGLTPHLASIGG